MPIILIRTFFMFFLTYIWIWKFLSQLRRKVILTRSARMRRPLLSLCPWDALTTRNVLIRADCTEISWITVQYGGPGRANDQRCPAHCFIGLCVDPKVGKLFPDRPESEEILRQVHSGPGVQIGRQNQIQRAKYILNLLASSLWSFPRDSWRSSESVSSGKEYD